MVHLKSNVTFPVGALSYGMSWPFSSGRRYAVRRNLRFCIDKRDVLIAWVTIQAYKRHIGSFLPSPDQLTNQVYSGLQESALLCNQMTRSLNVLSLA